MPANFNNNKGLLTEQGSNNTYVRTGRVMKDKEPNSRKITVFVKDLLPYYSGELEGKSMDYEVSDGGNYRGRFTATNEIEAEWLGDDTNRRFPPDVKKDEQVKVIIYADQDKAYWTSLGRDDDKRRTERIEFNVADTPDNPSPVNRENSYSISMDTQDKQEVNIQTSKTGGEEFAYTIKINAKDGKIFISDDANNEYVLESGVPRLYMKNNQGAMLEIAQKNVTIVAPEDWMVKVGRQAILDLPLIKMVNTNKAGITVWESAEAVFKMNSFVLDCPCIGLKGNVEANNIVSGNHFATSYSTIGGFSARMVSKGPNKAKMLQITARSASAIGFNTYRTPSIDIFSGIGIRANNSPNVNGGFTQNRHCTAWEDMSECVALICQDLLKIDGIIGYGNSCSEIQKAMEAAYMPINTGE